MSSHTYHGRNTQRSSARSMFAFLFLTITYLTSGLPSSAATLLPNGEQTFVDANGNPLAAGTVDFYIPATSTRKNTWLSSTTTVPNLNSNPVVLDSAGRAVIYGIGCYRQVVKSSLGLTQWDKTTCDTSVGQASWGGTATGTPNAIVVTADNFTGTSGDVIRFIAASNNSGPTTINPTVAGTAFGAVSVVVDGGSGPVACSGGEIITGNIVTVVYDSALGVFHISTVTAITAGAGLSTGGVGTSGGTIAVSGTLTSVQPVNAQTGTTYTVLNTDNGKLITLTNAAAITLTVPTATGNFAAGFKADVLNIGGTLITVTPASGTVNGASSITIPGGFRSIKLVSDGTNWHALYGQSPTGGSSTGYRSLVVQNNSGTPNTQVDVTAAYLGLLDTSGNSLSVLSVSVTCNYATNGANGLDTGAIAVGTWYHNYVISNGTTTACLGSTSSTAPTMPAGYTFKMRVGATKTIAGAATFNRTIQRGNRAYYVVVSGSPTPILPVINNGTVGTYSVTAPTWATPSITSVVPPTAGAIQVNALNSYGGGAVAGVQVAPTNAHAGWQNGAGNIPYFDTNGSAFTGLVSFWMPIINTTVAWTSSAAGGGLICAGWEDNL